MPHSCVGILFIEATGDSDNGVSVGVVDVAASNSAGGFFFIGGGFNSQLLHCFCTDSKPKTRKMHK